MLAKQEAQARREQGQSRRMGTRARSEKHRVQGDDQEGLRMRRADGQMQNDGFRTGVHRRPQVMPRGRRGRAHDVTAIGRFLVLARCRSGVDMRRQVPNPPQATQLVNVVVVMKRQVQRGQAV